MDKYLGPITLDDLEGKTKGEDRFIGIVTLDDLRSEEPEPLPDESRGVVSDTAAALAGGVVDTIEMGARIARHGKEPEEAPIATKIIEKTEQWQKDKPFLRPSAEAQRGGLRGAVYEGTRMAIPSLTAAVPGGIAGAWGSVPGVAIGAGTAAGAAFGIAEYDSFLDEVREYEKANNVQLDWSIVKSKALKSAMVETGLEGAATALDVVAAKVGGKTVDALKGIIKKRLKVGAKEVVTDMAAGQVLKKTGGELAKEMAGTYIGALPGEVGTEMAQSYFETKFRNDALIDSMPEIPSRRRSMWWARPRT